MKLLPLAVLRYRKAYKVQATVLPLIAAYSLIARTGQWSDPVSSATIYCL